MRTDEIGLPVVVPQRAAVVPARPGLQRHQWFPRAFGLLRRSHEIPLVRRAEEDVETSVVMPNRTGPHAIVVAVHPRPVQFRTDLRQVLNRIPADFPVHKVFGMQDGHARRELHRGRNGIVIVAHPDAINVTIIGRDDWIQVQTVSLVAPTRPISPFHLRRGFLPQQQACAAQC